MICKHCNSVIKDNSKFCCVCGSKIEETSIPAVTIDNFMSEEPPIIESPVENATENPTNSVPQPENVNQQNENYTYVQPDGYNTQPQNASVQSYQPQNNSYNNNGKKNNQTAIIVILSIIIVAIIGAILYFVVFKEDDSESNGADTSGTESVQTTTTENIPEYDNINDKTGSLSTLQLESIQELIDAKMDATELTIKLIIEEEIDDITEYCQLNGEQLCGSDGVLIVIDDQNRKCEVERVGEKSQEYMTNNLANGIKTMVEATLWRNSLYSACMKAINLLPEDIRQIEVTEETQPDYDYSPVDDAEQVVYVEQTSKTTAKLTLVDWSQSEPQVLLEYDKVYLGKDGITDSPSESKSATPKGCFELGFAFSDRNLDTGLDQLLITDGMVWVNDPNSSYYNTLQYGETSCSKWASAEDTYSNFKTGYAESCILIEHNGDGISKGEKNKGSCIYISGKSSGVSTSYGDVNLTVSQMNDLLYYLEESKNPHIVIY